MRKSVLIIHLLLASVAAFSTDTVTVWSPGRIQKLQVFETNTGEIKYTVSFKNRVIIHPSALGFKLGKPAALLNKFEILGSSRSSFDQTWKPAWGEVSQVRNHYEEIDLKLKSQGDPSILLNLVFRVFDDGIGFRYEFPRQKDLNHFIIHRGVIQ